MQIQTGPVALLSNLADSVAGKTISNDNLILPDIRFLRILGGMHSVAYVNSQGILLDRSGASTDASDTSFSKTSMEGNHFIGKPAPGALFEDKVLVTAPIISNGDVSGFILGAYEQEDFSGFLQYDIYGKNATVLIANSDGSIISGSDDNSTELLHFNSISEFFSRYNISESNQAFISSSLAGSAAVSGILSIDGAKKYMVYLPSELGVGILSFVDFSVISSQVITSTSILVLVVTVLCLIAMVSVIFAASKSCVKLVELENDNEELKIVEKEYKIATDHNNQILFRFYPEDGSVELSEELSALQGLPRIIKNSPELSVEGGLIDSESAQAYLKFFKSIRNRVPSIKCEIKCNFSTGAIWYDMDYTMLKNPNGESYAVISASDITERKNAEIEILKRSMEDSLTGALNRKAFEQRAIELIKKYHTKKHGIVMLDLDSFKAINDTFGHIMGDHVLFSSADSLRNTLNEDDLLGRLGGDEFMMLLKDIETDENAVNARLQALVNAVHSEYKPGNFTSASIGMSVYPTNGKTFDELYRTSDIAVYHAKKEGRNRFVVYSKDLEKNK